jgi:hypothetical protein
MIMFPLQLTVVFLFMCMCVCMCVYVCHTACVCVQKAVAAYIAGTLPLPADAVMREGVELARRIREQAPRPQFPHSDYVGMCLDWVRDLRAASGGGATSGGGASTGTIRAAVEDQQRQYEGSSLVFPPAGATGAGSVFTPSLLCSLLPVIGGVGGGGDGPLNAQLAADVEQYCQGKHLSHSIHAALQGPWQFQRALVSKLSSSPSGNVVGKITFGNIDRRHCATTSLSGRSVSAAGTDAGVEGVECDEWLYRESGKLTTSTGMTLDVNGTDYIYVLNGAGDCIDVYFVDKEAAAARTQGAAQGAAAGAPPPPPPPAAAAAAAARGGLFVSLRVVGRDDSGWHAVGEPHLCGQDTYNVKFHFAFSGVALQKIEIDINVLGPYKDYRSFTVLTR